MSVFGLCAADPTTAVPVTIPVVDFAAQFGSVVMIDVFLFAADRSLLLDQQV